MKSAICRQPAGDDLLQMALRAYVPSKRPANKWNWSQLGPSDWTLIFDTETTTDPAQVLRFGIYQVRQGQELWEAGIFINPAILTEWEISVIKSFSQARNYQLMTVTEFIEQVFFKIGYELRATIVGFNLPFDISRLAIGHGNSRGRTMKGGFSFQLSSNRYWPNIQIKHLSPRVSLIRFTTRPGRIAGRGMRKRKIKVPPRPGYFVDLKTFAAALTSKSFNLAGLADFLKTENRKIETEDHGKTVNDNYLFYALQDVQVTWECYSKLLEKFSEHNFSSTKPHQVFSEASIGKAYFKEMNIQPWRVLQPDFSEQLLGIIMSTYFGGRAEVHHRRIISQVRYCDFLSMYPTVCTLMKLWTIVISNGLKWRETAQETANFLQNVTLRDLQDHDSWSRLTTIVKVAPDSDVVPIRANYGGDEQSTIGLNYLHSDTSLWFTLPDCIASKFLSGKLPRVLRAITFSPDGVQSDLKPVTIAGNPDFQIDPYRDDFYRRVIDLRSAVKTRLKTVDKADRPTLESTQLTLKILANATSYGNFVELNVEELSRPEQRNCYGYIGEPFAVPVAKSEEPGRYFHPLIATLITGAARLMLAISERLTVDNGLDWAFCDTDSMAIAKPENMSDADFETKVGAIRTWFAALNPYAEKGPLLKLEDANYRTENGNLTLEFEPLFCFAVSAKRYALFNVGSNDEIFIRKASAHGLGHLLAPYGELEAPSSIPAPALSLEQIGVERWQYDVWHQTIRAVRNGHPDQVDFDYHPHLNLPAASRYSASTPNLLGWFDRHNEGRSYTGQVRPNNFLLAYQIAPTAIHGCPELIAAIADTASSISKPINWPKPVAPYDTNATNGARNCFDRDSGAPIPASMLKTYQTALAQYHLRPESKFLNGNYGDRGITKRRHVRPIAIRQIGKESNRWEERFYLGSEEGAEIDYGSAPQDSEAFLSALRAQIIETGQRAVARRTGVSRRTISRYLRGARLRKEITKKLWDGLREMQS